MIAGKRNRAIPRGKAASDRDTGGTISRRGALAVLLGAGPWLPRTVAGETEAPVRLAISAALMGDVNLNDARAATLIWVKQMTRDLSVSIDPKIFDPDPESGVEGKG